MDALSAFWPGVQVLKGDIQHAIETHELLYQIFQKYGQIPEAFTHRFDIHWGQYPLRPEFAESTYLLYKGWSFSPLVALELILLFSNGRSVLS